MANGVISITCVIIDTKLAKNMIIYYLVMTINCTAEEFFKNKLLEETAEFAEIQLLKHLHETTRLEENGRVPRYIGSA